MVFIILVILVIVGGNIVIALEANRNNTSVSMPEHDHILDSEIIQKKEKER